MVLDRDAERTVHKQKVMYGNLKAAIAMTVGVPQGHLSIARFLKWDISYGCNISILTSASRGQELLIVFIVDQFTGLARSGLSLKLYTSSISAAAASVIVMAKQERSVASD